MDNSLSKNLWLIQIEFLLCTVMLTLLPISFKPALASGFGNRTDRLALLALKDQFVGGSPGVLNSWNDSLHFCDWEGVKCGHRHQRVSTLNLTGLEIGGIISPFIGNLTFLRKANFSYNKLKGNIPKEFGHLRRLRYLDIWGNNLQGQLPVELTNCSNLQWLYLTNNNLTGKIPFNLGGMKNLFGLYLGKNKLTGTIPSSFGNLSSLNVLALEYNYLEGIIPSALGRLSSLEVLSLGANKLSGIVPPTVYNLSSITSFSLAANQLFDKLPPKLGFVFPKLEKFYIGGNQFTGMIPKSASNISGLKGNDFKALVFEFMPNGSLEDWLHGQHESRYLNLAQRLDIAIDVANAMDYLHHDCGTLIVHCDLKPTNVLLDDDMVAHVSDFGLAKLLSVEQGSIGSDQTNSSTIKGTIGYVAPEYGIGRTVSPEGDIYSFGILLLEMITGRRPIDDMFHDGLSLHNFYKMALPERLERILDFHLLEEIGEHRQRLRSWPDKEEEIWECLVSFTKIGVACSVEVLKDRMKIKDAIIELHATKAKLLCTGVYVRDRR
ncbi:hypothetical protein DITRI_Ditri09bG0147100 [Diplodiscus trichospermus]